MPGADDIQYSDRYYDKEYEYRHVILPPDIARLVPRTHLLSETEWRNIGVQQSPGWTHYLLHTPEPHVLLFRRLKPKDETATTSSSSAVSQQTNQNNRPSQSSSQASTVTESQEYSQQSQSTSTVSTSAVCG